MKEKVNRKEQVKCFMREHSGDIAFYCSCAMVGAVYGLGYRHGVRDLTREINTRMQMLSLVEPEFDTVFNRGCETLKQKWTK